MNIFEIVVFIFLTIRVSAQSSSDLINHMLNIPYNLNCTKANSPTNEGQSSQPWQNMWDNLNDILNDVFSKLPEKSKSCGSEMRVYQSDRECLIEELKNQLIGKIDELAENTKTLYSSLELDEKNFNESNESEVQLADLRNRFIVLYLIKKYYDDHFKSDIFNEALSRARKSQLESFKNLLTRSKNKKELNKEYQIYEKQLGRGMELFERYSSFPSSIIPLGVCTSYSEEPVKQISNEMNKTNDKINQCVLNSSDFYQYLKKIRQSYKKSGCFDPASKKIIKSSFCKSEHVYIIAGLSFEDPSCGVIRGSWTIENSQLVPSKTNLVISFESTPHSTVLDWKILNKLLIKVDEELSKR